MFAACAVGLMSATPEWAYAKKDAESGIRYKAGSFDLYHKAGAPCSGVEGVRTFLGNNAIRTFCSPTSTVQLMYCPGGQVWAAPKPSTEYVCRPASMVFKGTSEEQAEQKTKEYYDKKDPDGYDEYRTALNPTVDGNAKTATVDPFKDSAGDTKAAIDKQKKSVRDAFEEHHRDTQIGRANSEETSAVVMEKYNDWKEKKDQLDEFRKNEPAPETWKDKLAAKAKSVFASGSRESAEKKSLAELEQEEKAAADAMGAAIRTARSGPDAPKLSPEADRAIAQFSETKFAEEDAARAVASGGAATAPAGATADATKSGDPAAAGAAPAAGAAAPGAGTPADGTTPPGATAAAAPGQPGREWYGHEAPKSRAEAEEEAAEKKRQFGDAESAIARDGGKRSDWTEKDHVNEGDECAYSGAIRASNGTLCKATKGFVQGAEIANAAGQAIGATAVSAIGDREAQKLLETEIANGQNGQAISLQAASYDAAAATAETTGKKEVGLAITNTVLGATSTSLAVGHGVVAGNMKRTGGLGKSDEASNIQNNQNAAWTKGGQGMHHEQEVMADAAELKKNGKAKKYGGVGGEIYDSFKLDQSYDVALLDKRCEPILQAGEGASKLYNQKDIELCRQAKTAQNESIRDKQRFIESKVKKIGGRAASEQGGMAVVATVGAIKSMSQATAGYINWKTSQDLAKRYREIADDLRAQAQNQQAPVEFEWDPGDEGGESLPSNPVTPGDGDGGFGGAEESALSEEPDFGVGTDPNYNPNNVNPGPQAGMFSQGGPPKGGPAAGLPGLPGGGAMSPDGTGKEESQEALANAKEGVGYGAGGGGGYGRGGGSDGVENGGINLAGIMGQLAEMVTGKKEDPKSGESRFDGDRAAASNYSPLLGANTDIFQRITTRYREKTREGVFNPTKL